MLTWNILYQVLVDISVTLLALFFASTMQTFSSLEIVPSIDRLRVWTASAIFLVRGCMPIC